jgi:NAD(P)-dependent dehydrogenase (short-subunit alcohol dehydrogenase family)
MELSGKVAVIAGGAWGIGRETGLLFASEAAATVI